MKVGITEEYLYKLFEDDDVDGVIRILDVVGLNGEDDFYYDRTRESFLRYLLSIAIAHANINHLSDYMLVQLVNRVSVCCEIFQLAKLIKVAAGVSSRGIPKLPDDLRHYLTMDKYEDDDLEKACDRLRYLGEQETRTLLCHLAQADSELSPALRFNSLIIRRIHTCRLVPDTVLLAAMIAALFEVTEKRGPIRSLFNKLTGGGYTIQ